ncbi:MAG: hypothetical protein PF503_08315 [Desulfobacula sp.]|jgi:phage FluMu protein Com|nr:hypothetical protein [Desulfobacula sp.]
MFNTSKKEQLALLYLGVIEIECPNCKKIIRTGSEDDISCPECKVIILQHSINSIYQGEFHHGLHS